MNIILWDWDNTLVDTFGAIFAAQNETRKHYNMPLWTPEESKMAMNTSGRNLIKDVFGAERATEARAIYLKAYAMHAADLKLKEGALEILKFGKTAGFIQILASNKAGSILRNEAETLGVSQYFDRLIGAEDTDSDKPSKTFTDSAIQGFDVKKIISIGDGKSDIQMARNYENGIGILVGTNPHSKEFEILHPDYAVSDLKEALPILKNLIAEYIFRFNRNILRCSD